MDHFPVATVESLEELERLNEQKFYSKESGKVIKLFHCETNEPSVSFTKIHPRYFDNHFSFYSQIWTGICPLEHRILNQILISIKKSSSPTNLQPYCSASPSLRTGFSRNQVPNQILYFVLGFTLI